MAAETTVLSNGITVVSERMPDVRSVSLGLWYHVGSRNERGNQAGLAHFMEHMMFKGTPTRSAVEISAAFDGLGADLNAFTGKEYTCYYTRCVDEKLEQVLPVLADMVLRSSFSEECVQTEREVVLEEIARAEDQPDDFVFDLFMRTALQEHPLGKPVLGSAELVGGYTHADCRAFHDEHYHAGNLVVAAVGSVEHGFLCEQIAKNFSSMKQGSKTEHTPVADTRRLPFVAQQRDTEQAHVIIGYDWMTDTSVDRFAGSLFSSIFGGSMSSRLFQEVREKLGLAYSIYAHPVLFTDAARFCIYAGTRPENLEQVVGIVRREIAKMIAEGPTAAEVTRQCEAICGSLLMSMESTSSRMVRMGRTQTLGNPIRTVDELVSIYRSLTVDDVARVAQRYLQCEPTIAVISPYSEEEARSKVGL